MKELKQENSLLRQAVHNDYEVPMVANSKVMRAFMRDLMKVAPTDAWVLITGENGTGKSTLFKRNSAGQQLGKNG